MARCIGARHQPGLTVEADILIIDDDVELCQLLTEFLGLEGFAVRACHSGSEGLQQALGQ